MKLWKKFALGVVGLVVVAPLIAAAVIRFKPLNVSPLWTEVIAATPERTERGRYLFLHATNCAACHSQRDFSRYGGPPVAGTVGGGGERFGHAEGFPGEVVAPNITPNREAGVGAWTDGELVRAIREGVDRRGEPMAPVMPYASYRALSDDDVRALVVYLRALPPLPTPAPPHRQLDFPLSLFVRLIPRPAGTNGHVAAVPPAPTVDYGRYLASIAGCRECHTPMSRGRPIEGMAFAGGMEFRTAWGVVRSANLTPDATGLGAMTEDAFLLRFRMYRLPDDASSVPRAAPGATNLPANTVMPWSGFAGMTDDDLRAIYRFLRTLRPLHQVVTRFTR